MPNGAVRLRVGVQYRGQAWTTVQIDLSRSEVEGLGSEPAPGLSLEAFGLVGPAIVPCLPLAYQIAQKLHAITDPAAIVGAGERLRHVVDLLLLRTLIRDRHAVRTACERLFEARATHAWPPAVPDLSPWAEAYARLAAEVGVLEPDVEVATRELAAMVAEIASA
jgi:Nucleotidyl transferase AbiEii toxin, Type IV TA system